MVEVGNYSQAELMVLATWMYYDDGMTHQEVANELSVSRVAVTRLLQKARQQGLVRFEITSPRPVQYELSQQLVNKFGLQRAIVVKTANTLEETLEAVAQAGAKHLQELIYPGCRLGVGWSSTLRRMDTYLEPFEEPVDFTINELVGSIQLVSDNLYRISVKLEEILGGKLITLPVPVVVQNAEAYDAFMKEPSIRAGLEGARNCDIAFVGLGCVCEDCTMVETGYCTPEQIALLAEQGAVGDTLLRFFALDGSPVPSPEEDKIFSLTLEEIKAIPYTATLVAGERKIDTIRGALAGGFLDCLIIDTDTASAVLSEHAKGVCSERDS